MTTKVNLNVDHSFTDPVELLCGQYLLRDDELYIATESEVILLTGESAGTATPDLDFLVCHLVDSLEIYATQDAVD